MKVEHLPVPERQALYGAYKKFCTGFQQHADRLIQHGAPERHDTSDPILVVFNVDQALNEEGYDVEMSKLGSETAATFAHAAKRTLTSVAWPAIDQLEVEGGTVVLRIPLAAGRVD